MHMMLFTLALGVAVCGFMIVLAKKGRRPEGDGDKWRKRVDPDSKPHNGVDGPRTGTSSEQGVGEQSKGAKARDDVDLTARNGRVKEATQPPAALPATHVGAVQARALPIRNEKEDVLRAKDNVGIPPRIAVKSITPKPSRGQLRANQGHGPLPTDSDPRSPIASSGIPPRISTPSTLSQRDGPSDVPAPAPLPSETTQGAVTIADLPPVMSETPHSIELPASTVSDTSAPPLTTTTSTSTPSLSKQTRILPRVATHNIPPARGRTPMSLDQAAFNLNAFADPATAGPNGIGSPPLSVIGSPISPPPDKGGASWFDLLSPQ
ncbi:hypothetical protein C8Q78DRAFT_1074364 [Trametes maxima]|nr:hypothetical protein C8Q78DRAFT_1074364 [Trametes maxima]